MNKNAFLQEASTVPELFGRTSRSAAEMTHILRKVGNGNMQQGIQRISLNSYKEGVMNGKQIGTIRGSIVGSAATGGLLLSFYCFVQGIKWFKERRKSAKEIEREKAIYWEAIDSASERSDEFAEDDEMAQPEDGSGRSECSVPQRRQQDEED